MRVYLDACCLNRLFDDVSQDRVRLDAKGKDMIHTEGMTPVEIQSAGLRVLAHELGAYGLVRFLQQFERGVGDYTRERHEWLDPVGMDAVFDDIVQLRNDRPPKAD